MRFFYLFLLLIITNSINAQTRQIKGKTQNGFTKEAMPYTSVYWKKAGFGITSDSIGLFYLMPSKILNDTIVVSYIG